MSPRRRGATGLSGVLCVDKPKGPTSHDVVAAVRRATGEGRVGHAGTLDPMATGLLVVLVGPATRLEPFLSSASKSYRATVRFGAETDTDDAEGSVTESAPVPETLFDPEVARAAVAELLGESSQMPPAYSAIKVGGTVAHRAARSGNPVELKPRLVTVFQAALVDVDPVAATWTVDVTLSKGTYVRAIARDLGRALGTRAHLAELRRTAAGALDIACAHQLDAVTAAAERGELTALFTDPVAALGMTRLIAEEKSIADGRQLPRSLAPHVSDGECVAVTSPDGRLLAIYTARPDALAAAAVLPGGVSGQAGDR